MGDGREVNVVLYTVVECVWLIEPWLMYGGVFEHDVLCHRCGVKVAVYVHVFVAARAVSSDAHRNTSLGRSIKRNARIAFDMFIAMPPACCLGFLPLLFC